MKRVDIISKVVGRSDTGKPVGGGISIPMGNYALKSDFESMKSMFNDFLEGDDTDSVINRWKDLEAFLDGISEDNTLDSILKAYVTLSGTQTIIGEKNFTGGLKVNGSPIYYDTEKKYWKLEGDLLVTGGVTMYGNEGTFTPSTIMDAIAVDGTTISKEGGILKVIGDLSGGATTLGSLANVGSWADSVAPQDRIMYQAANSSQWVAKNLSDLAVGGVTGDYLPLSGGTINGSGDYLYVPLYINALNNQISGITFKTNGTEIGHVGYSSGLGIRLHSSTAAGIAVSDSDEPIFYSDDGSIKNTIWHSGNFTPSNYLPLSGGTMTGTINTQFIRPSVNAAYQCGTSSLRWNNVYSVYGNFSDSVTINGNTAWHAGNDGSGSGLDADLLDGKHYSDIINDNVASATKLQTARTIWGQSFDGTGGVDGDLTANGNITMRTGTAFDASRYLTLTNNASQYGRIGIHINGSTQDGNDHWGDGGRSIITFRRKYGTATSYTYSYAIQHNLVDNTLGILYGSNVGILLNGAGNVGIGTPNPLAKLQVEGLVKINASSYGVGLEIVKDVNDISSINLASTSTDLWQISARYTSSENGNLKIYYYDGSTWANPLSINKSGNILVSGGITMYSARKLKNITDERGLSLKELSVIKPTRFTWKDGRDDKIHIGGIADDVQKVLPEVIYKTGEDDTLTMDYGNAAFAIAASLIKPVVNHEERIRQLEEENKRLKEEVEQLKWNIA